MRRNLLLGSILLFAGLLSTLAGVALAWSGHDRTAAVSARLAGTDAAAAADAPLLATQADWASKVIRLHVIANSDSDEDQNLKRAVRDAILEQVTPLFEALTTQEQALAAIEAAIPQIEQAAARVIAAGGREYPVTAEVGWRDFPGKAYGDLFLPAGVYRALDVKIGEAKGANWWCVLFPPLCFADWSTGVVLEPKPGTGGAETVTVPWHTGTEAAQAGSDPGTLRVPPRRPPVALVDEESLAQVRVVPRLAVVEWVKEKVLSRKAALLRLR